MAKILVTGGAGYVGSHVVQHITSAGHEVVVLDNLSTGHMQAVLPPAELIIGELSDTDLLDAIFREHTFDAVFHFAAHSLVHESVTDPLKYIDNNLINGVKLLRTMLAHNVDKMIFSSTAAVYGEPEEVPIRETHRTEPTNPYGESKLAYERILAASATAYGLRYAALRYFNAAGADPTSRLGEDHTPETHLIPLVLRAAMDKREVIRIFGTDYDTPDGTCVRDYVHVNDLATGHMLAFDAMRDGQALGAYNLGNGQGFSVREVIRITEAITGQNIETNAVERRAGDPGVLVASADRAREELGWKPLWSDLRSIIESAWSWHSSHPDGYSNT